MFIYRCPHTIGLFGVGKIVFFDKRVGNRVGNPYTMDLHLISTSTDDI